MPLPYPGQQGNSAEELEYLDQEQPINYDDGSPEGDHYMGRHYDQPHPECPWCQEPGPAWHSQEAERYDPNGEYESKVAENGGPSMPPNAVDGMNPQMGQQQGGQPARPYNPAVQENMLGDMHPAAQYAYDRAVQQGAKPEEALQMAQQSQQGLIDRAQQGQQIDNIVPMSHTFVSDDIIEKRIKALSS